VFCSWVSECTRQTCSKGLFLCSCSHLSTLSLWFSSTIAYILYLLLLYGCHNCSLVILHHSLYPSCRFSSMWTQLPVIVNWHLFLQTWVHCVVNSMMEVVSCERSLRTVPRSPQYRLVSFVQSIFCKMSLLLLAAVCLQTCYTQFLKKKIVVLFSMSYMG
jgi:hypothetical protein